VSTLPIKENGYGLLLTPSTVDIGINEGRMEKRTEYRESIGRHYTPGRLTEQIQGLLPTPLSVQRVRSEETMKKCADFRLRNANQKTVPLYLEETIRNLLPTPDCSDRRGKNSKQQGLSNVMKGMLRTPTAAETHNQSCSKQIYLQDQVGITNKLIPTPATRDYKGTNSQEHFDKVGQMHMTQLPNALKYNHGISGQLNPRFVAEMMGFPPDWTELPFLNGETKA
jgi:hypothetical protein